MNRIPIPQSFGSRTIFLIASIIIITGFGIGTVVFMGTLPFKALIFLSLVLLFLSLRFEFVFFFLVFFIVFQIHLNVSFGRFDIQPVFFIIPFLFLKMILDSILEEKRIFHWSPADLFLILITLAFTISSIKCYYILGEQTFLKSMVFVFKFLLISLLFYITFYYLRNLNNIYRILKILSGVLLLLSISGIVEYVGIKLGFDYQLRQFYRLFGVTRFHAESFATGKSVRISGLIGSPESFGFLLAFLFPPIIGLRFYSIKYRWIVDLTILMCILSIMISGTRSALFAVGVYVVIFAVLGSKRFFHLKLLLILFVLFITISPLSNTMYIRTQELFQSDSYQLMMRSQFHKVAYNLFKKEMWFGTGWGTFNDNYIKHLSEFPVLYESRRFAHPGRLHKIYNVYLQFLHDLGIFGLIIFLIFWIRYLILSLKIFLYAENIVLRYVGLGFFSTLITWSILGYAGSAGFILSIGWNAISPFFWIFCGIIFSIYHRTFSPPNNPGLSRLYHEKK